MSTLRVQRTANLLIAGLAPCDQELLEPHLVTVELKFRQRLESANTKVDRVYFIDRGLASVIATGGGRRRQAEVAVVGREGMTGVSVILGVERSPYEVLMQTEGRARAIPATLLRLLLGQSNSLVMSLLRYVHVVSVQIAHTALANAQGKIEERLARWLLMAHDRFDTDDLPITHEFLSVMLGVRRAGVTLALHRLDSVGLISTARGCVTVLDRQGLQERANGLYGVPELEFERLFGAHPSEPEPP